MWNSYILCYFSCTPFFDCAVAVASNISLVSSLESPILVGSTVTLTCSVSLAPGPYYDAPKFSWQGPGLPPSNVISNSGVLTLSDITASNAGEYTCIASLYPNISLSTYVTVESKSNRVYGNCVLSKFLYFLSSNTYHDQC